MSSTTYQLGDSRWLRQSRIYLPMQETWVQSLSQEEPLEKGKTTYPSILPWEIPWTEEPGRLQTMGSKALD